MHLWAAGPDSLSFLALWETGRLLFKAAIISRPLSFCARILIYGGDIIASFASSPRKDESNILLARALVYLFPHIFSTASPYEEDDLVDLAARLSSPPDISGSLLNS